MDQASGNEGWGVYHRWIKDKPATFIVHLKYADEAPVFPYTHLYMLSIEADEVDEDGYPTEAELNHLLMLDQELENLFTPHKGFLFAGTITTDKKRIHYAYGASKDMKSNIREVMDAHAVQRSYIIQYREDKSWELYLEHLYPDEYEMQSIKNYRLFATLESEGDQLQKSRDVHHWLYFTTRSGRFWWAYCWR